MGESSNLMNRKQSSIVPPLAKAQRVQAMRKAFNVVKKRQRSNIRRIPDMEGRKKRLRQARRRAIGNEVLLKEAIENLRQNGIRVQRADSCQEAVSLVVREIGDTKLVVKSKSNLTKEVGLNEALDVAGIEVIETDIGDRIIQLCGDVPSHPTGPASHLTRYDIAKILSRHFRKKVKPTPEMIVDLIRSEIATYINRSTIGITGANAIAAEEGAILLLHNEGNILQVSMRPKKHIILVGTDKIYPNIEEAMNMLKIQTFYATGSLATSFVNIISAPSQTADIEKQLIKGVHGPGELCVIMVDNHRSEIVRSEYKDLLYCIGCGQCLLICPAYGVYGNRFGVDSHLGGRGLVYAALSGQDTVESNKGLNLCLSCRKCQQNCPVAIDIPSMITRLRLDRDKILEPHLQTAYDFLRAHIEWAGSVLRQETLLLAAKLWPKADND
jgi:L-lactate dehydrogenase complex protein LldG